MDASICLQRKEDKKSSPTDRNHLQGVVIPRHHQTLYTVIKSGVTERKRPFYTFYNKFKKQTLSVKILGHSHIRRQRPVGYQLISQRTLSDVRKHGTMPPIYWLLIIDKDSSSMTPKLFPPSPTCNAEHVVLSLSPVDETMTVYSRHLVRLFEQTKI